MKTLASLCPCKGSHHSMQTEHGKRQWESHYHFQGAQREPDMEIRGTRIVPVTTEVPNHLFNALALDLS